jgi:hypothetical protein
LYILQRRHFAHTKTFGNLFFTPDYMKTSCLVLVLLSSILAGAQTLGTATQTTLPPPTAYSIVANDANSRVWERTTYEQGPNGTVVPKKHRVTELETGMYFQSNGQWVESKEEIDLLPQGGAAATNGQIQVYFPGDIYQGEIQMLTPEGEQLQSQPVGICYDDGTNTVLIAALTNSVGELDSPNQIIYPNAFAGTFQRQLDPNLGRIADSHGLCHGQSGKQPVFRACYRDGLSGFKR